MFCYSMVYLCNKHKKICTLSQFFHLKQIRLKTGHDHMVPKSLLHRGNTYDVADLNMQKGVFVLPVLYLPLWG